MSMNGGDVAEQMVRILLNGTETVVRISGEGARHITAFLMAWAQQDHSRDLARHGRTSMVRLLKSGQELQVFRMRPEEYTAFKPQAKQYRLLYSALRNKQDKDGLIDLVVRADEIPRVNHIFERIGYGSVQQGVNSKKKNLRRCEAQKMQRPDRCNRTEKTSPLLKRSPLFALNWRSTARIPRNKTCVCLSRRREERTDDGTQKRGAHRHPARHHVAQHGVLPDRLCRRDARPTA